jgi:hypothetical protein
MKVNIVNKMPELDRRFPLCIGNLDVVSGASTPQVRGSTRFPADGIHRTTGACALRCFNDKYSKYKTGTSWAECMQMRPTGGGASRSSASAIGSDAGHRRTSARGVFPATMAAPVPGYHITAPQEEGSSLRGKDARAVKGPTDGPEVWAEARGTRVSRKRDAADTVRDIGGR